MNASPASPACAATGTPPRDTGVRGTDRHVLHLRAGPVAPAVGRLVVGEGAGGQTKFQGHRTPRPVLPSTSRLLAGDTESGKRAGPLQGLELLVSAPGRIEVPKPCRWLGQTSRRPSSREEGHQQRGVRESDARPILSGAGRRAGRSGGGSVRASAQGALRLGSPRREPQHEVL